MYSLRTHALISGGLLAAMIILGVTVSMLGATGVIKNPTAYQTLFRVLFFGLFLAFGFSLVPLIVKVVLTGQIHAGNSETGLIKVAVEHQGAIIWTLWFIIGLGLAIALPFAIRDNFMSDASAGAGAAAEIADMPNQEGADRSAGDVVAGADQPFKVQD